MRVSTVDIVASPPRRPLASRRRRPTVAAGLVHERARLRGHFREVLAELRARDVGGLTPAQRAVRGALLRELARYAAAGVFPRNLDHPGRRVPHFVDAAGTPCAMARLIGASGHPGLVARIASTANLAYIRELADDAELQGWLAWAGLDVAEAARIQPAYCFVTRAEECFCDEVFEQPDGVLEATVLARGGGEVTVEIDAVHGEVGALAVGDELAVGGEAEVGSDTLVTVVLEADALAEYSLRRVDAEGAVELACNNAVPALESEDAIAALLTGSSDACVAHLEEVDAEWGESICDESVGCGCTTKDDGGGSLGGLLLIAAWWARRRRRAPRGASARG